MEPTSTQPPRWTETATTGLGFLVLSLLMSYPAGLRPDLLPLGNGDAAASYFPYMLRSFRPLTPELAGSFDPTLFTGLPESHSSFGRYYPPTIVLYSLLPPVLALGWSLVLHHTLAGWGAYILLRTSGRSRAAAWLAGIAFAFGGFMIFHRGHVNMHQAAAWLPWVLWAFERFRREGGVFWVVLAGTLMALHSLTGHLQTIAMGGLVWLTYLGFFAVAGPGWDVSRLRFIVGTGGACVLGAVGSLAQVLPMMEVASWSVYQKFDLGFFNNGNLKARFLPGLIGPWVLGGRSDVGSPLGYWGLTEHGIFQGVVALALVVIALAALVLRRLLARSASEGLSEPSLALRASEDARKLTRFWLVLFVGSLLLMLGDNAPLYRLLSYLPVYQLFHVPARHAWIFGLALAWLAGWGLDQLRQSDAVFRKRLLRAGGSAFLVVLVVSLVAARVACTWPTPPAWNYLGFLFPLGSGVVALVSLAVATRASRLIALVPLLAFVELWLTVRTYELAPRPAAFVTQCDRFPEVVRWLRDLDSDTPRCVVQSAAWDTDGQRLFVPSALGSAWGLAVQNAYSQSMPRSLVRLLGQSPYGEVELSRLLLEQRGLSAVGGRYIVVTNPPQVRFTESRGYLAARREDLRWTENGPASISAQAFLRPGQTYFFQARLRCGQPLQGKVHFQLTQRISRHECHCLADVTLGADDFHDGMLHLRRVIETRPVNGQFGITIQGVGTPRIDLADLALWCLTPAFAESVRKSTAAEVEGWLHERVPGPYELAAVFAPQTQVLDNHYARQLATLVRKVRPAESDLAAADAQLAAREPVRELAFVVTPGGRSADFDLDGPRDYPKGTVEVRSYKPDDIRLRATTTDGPGFLVLTVTRCRGWSATVDDREVPIHAVDGPLMGVCLPPGEHEVRFCFRPVLVEAGATAALVVFGGAWLGCLAWYGKRWTRAKPQAAHTTLGGFAHAA